MDARQFADQLIEKSTELRPETQVEARFFIGGETVQLPIADVYLVTSPSRTTLVIEVAKKR